MHGGLCSLPFQQTFINHLKDKDDTGNLSSQGMSAPKKAGGRKIQDSRADKGLVIGN